MSDVSSQAANHVRFFYSRDLRGRVCRRGYYDAELKLHGRECHWNDAGVMVRTIEWCHGVRQGPTITYNSLGQKTWMGNWHKGSLQSITRYCLSTCNPIFFLQIQDGVVPPFLLHAAR